MELPGVFQVLYYGEDGALRSGSAHWEGKHSLNADETSEFLAIPMPGEAQAAAGSGNILVKVEFPMEITAATSRGIPMVTGLNLGEPRQANPERPSLILRRAGEKRLWDLAKDSGSTVEAIRKANNLQDEPAPNQMLLIPVG